MPNTTVQQTSSYCHGILTHCTTGHCGQLNTHYHQATYLSSPLLTYDMTTTNRRTFNKHKKADWTQFTEDTESAFAQTIIPTNMHSASRILTNVILMSNKHNLPKGKMYSICRLLLDHIVCKITQRQHMESKHL